MKPATSHLHSIRAADQEATDEPVEESGRLVAQDAGREASQDDGDRQLPAASDVRLGEAAVPLGLASRDEALQELARQYRYDYVPGFRVDERMELVAACEPFGEEAEAFRSLRTDLLAGLWRHGSKRPALAVVSENRKDGRSYIAANLAICLAQTGARTLLIDADLRSARQHALLGTGADVGLSSLMAGRCTEGHVRSVPQLRNLFLVPSGPLPPNPVELLQQPDFARLLDDMGEVFDHVVIDTPAASAGSDARVIANAAGAALVIVRQHRTEARQCKAFLRTLQQGDVQLAGVVLNEH